MTVKVPAFMDVDRELMNRLADELGVSLFAFRAQTWKFFKQLVTEG